MVLVFIWTLVVVKIIAEVVGLLVVTVASAFAIEMRQNGINIRRVTRIIRHRNQ